MIKFKISDYAVFDDGFGNCSFLGRRKLLYNITNRFVNEKEVQRYCFSGLFRNGKSSLFHEVERIINDRSASEYNGKTIAICYSLGNWSPADQSLFEDIMEAIHDKVRQFLPHEVDSEPYYRAFRSCSTISCRARKASDYLKYLHDNHFHIALFIDEFQLLPNYEECSYQELSNLHSLPYICIAYVGRLPFNVTVKQMKTFPLMGASLPCEQETVMGFSDEDIDLFRKEFVTQYNFDLIEGMDLIRYHCGRSPYLFAIVGTEIQRKLDNDRNSAISREWLETVLTSRNFEEYFESNVDYVLRNDQINGMDNLTRLQRIMIGPSIGIRKNDMNIMREMGYIDRFGEQDFALTPSFIEWLRRQEITGTLPDKMVRAERLLKHLIRSKASEIERMSEAADTIPTATYGYQWTTLDRSILGMQLSTIPKSTSNVEQFGEPYSLGSNIIMAKYARWINTEHDNNRPVDLLEVLLLKDRLGILMARWNLFSPYLGGTDSEWQGRLIRWCAARDPALHANDYLSEQDEAECERCCDEIIRRIGPMFANVG